MLPASCEVLRAPFTQHRHLTSSRRLPRQRTYRNYCRGAVYSRFLPICETPRITTCIALYPTLPLLFTLMILHSILLPHYCLKSAPGTWCRSREASGCTFTESEAHPLPVACLSCSTLLFFGLANHRLCHFFPYFRCFTNACCTLYSFHAVQPLPFFYSSLFFFIVSFFTIVTMHRNIHVKLCNCSTYTHFFFHAVSFCTVIIVLFSLFATN